MRPPMRLCYGIPIPHHKKVDDRNDWIYKCPMCDEWVGRTQLRNHLKNGCDNSGTYEKQRRNMNYKIESVKIGETMLYLSPLNNRLYPTEETVRSHHTGSVFDKTVKEPGKKIFALKSDKVAFHRQATRLLIEKEPVLLLATLNKIAPENTRNDLALYFGYHDWRNFVLDLGDLYFQWNIGGLTKEKASPFDRKCLTLGCIDEKKDSDLFCLKCQKLSRKGRLELLETGKYLRRRSHG